LEKKITVISPTIEQDNVKRFKVAAYCRVSTAYGDQALSLKLQVTHFAKLICENPDRDFAGMYADTESGVSVESRDELNRMLRDCPAHLFALSGWLWKP